MASPEPVPNQVRSPVHAGQVVDRKYRVDGVLGAGGMGIVVSATHLALDEPVALKFMTLGEGRGDSTARSRFLREAKAARRLTSAHVAKVFDVGQLPTGEPYIVMELLRGDDLAKHLRTKGRLSAADTVHYMLQVCDAIREAHALGIVHRDLKPQNLFLTRRPGGGVLVKVLDFGIAKSLETTGEDAALTTSQNIVGSPIYMSPEQLRASKHVDERTDIWSLGIIMFELLSGKVPFVGDSVLELGMRIMTVPAPSLVELREEIPGTLADVVQHCLEKDPEKRFPSIDALALALKPFADASGPSLPFADTLDEVLPSFPPRPLDEVRTGGEFAGTNRGATGPTRRTARTWAAVALVPVAIVAVAFGLHRDRVAPRVAAPPTPPAPVATDSDFHVELRVHPASARIHLDAETPGPSPFIRDLARDGRPHTLVVEAEGFEPLDLSFRDAPPPAEVTLKPLWQAAPTAPSSAPLPSAAAVTPHREGRPKAATGSSAASTTSAPPATSATSAPTATPRTTNDAPIVR